MVRRAEAVKNCKKSESKWKKEVKAQKKQNKMLFSIAKKSSSCREPKNIKNINNIKNI